MKVGLWWACSLGLCRGREAWVTSRRDGLYPQISVPVKAGSKAGKQPLSLLSPPTEPPDWQWLDPRTFAWECQPSSCGFLPQLWCGPRQGLKGSKDSMGVPFHGAVGGPETSKLFCFFYELQGALSPQESHLSLHTLPSQQITTAKSPGRGFYILKKEKKAFIGRK